MHICDGLWVAHVSRNKTSAEADVLRRVCEQNVGRSRRFVRKPFSKLWKHSGKWECHFDSKSFCIYFEWKG